MKKIITICLITLLISTCTAFAAKYKVNTSGVVKTNGKVVSPSQTSTPIQTNPYSVYDAQNYTSSNIVNKTQVPYIELVMDYSGSMVNCIEVAKSAMRRIINQIPKTTYVGFRVFGHDNNGLNPNNNNTLAEVKRVVKQNGKYKVVTGHDKCLGTVSGYCSATNQVAPIIQANSNMILSGMNSVSVGGSTPLVYGLDRAIYQDFAKLDTTTPKKIVLITDGGENCGGDPCAFAKTLMSKRKDVHIDVVLVNGWFSNGLSCLAKTTGGKVYKVNDLSNFSTVMVESMNSTPTQTQTKTNKDAYYRDYS